MKEPIVVVTGCFQLLHKGHLYLLKKARTLGRIILLLNSDEAILKMKGYLAEDFETRKTNLLATGLVSEVRKFETNPAEEIERIQPDYWVAGRGHSIKAMRKLSSAAKQIIIFPYDKGTSSTKIYNATKHTNTSRNPTRK